MCLGGLITVNAVECPAQPAFSFFRVQHPGPVEKRRDVTQVMGVATIEVGYPVAFLILVVADNFTLQVKKITSTAGLP